MSQPSRRRRWGIVVAVLIAALGAVVWWLLRDAEPRTAQVEESVTSLLPLAVGDAGQAARVALQQPASPRRPQGPEALGVFVRRPDGGRAPDAMTEIPTPTQSPAAGEAALGGSATPTTLTLAVLSGRAGTLEGRVTTGRRIPAPRELQTGSDPVCHKLGPARAPAASIDAEGNVGDAFVRIQTATDVSPPADPVIVSQRGCAYVPRVQGALKGQTIQIRNEDGTLHNVHGYVGIKTVFNQAQPAKSAPVTKSIDPTAPLLKLRCDVHPWMTGYVVQTNNPYFAVTDSQGHYRIEGAPAGRYTLTVWHEVLGEKSVPVQVEVGKATSIDVRL